MLTRERIVEALADLEHKRWASWQQYVHNLSPLNDKGERVIPAESVKHWERQIATDYKDLTEREKEMDRKEVYKTLAILSEIEEPLAILADRVLGYHHLSIRKHVIQNMWSIELPNDHVFYGNTYLEAEAKARAFLAGLPDVERGGK